MSPEELDRQIDALPLTLEARHLERLLAGVERPRPKQTSGRNKWQLPAAVGLLALFGLSVTYSALRGLAPTLVVVTGRATMGDRLVSVLSSPSSVG